uniref:NADH dehydrogenase subunit 4 n=1 Tax=Edenia gomezpompae TaxID=461172 RepID=UPI001D122026|nr:NADH dehydrogenase subunit 4 [Edenia gomezpompae]UAJ48646.1 NADH dehydrogenase subunit 4 [Edenia gomezpompae]
MLLSSLLITPLIGALAILVTKDTGISLRNIKRIALTISTINFFISLVIFILFDFSTNQFQFVQEYHEVSYFDFYLGVDGLSIYFILLTTLIIPISLVSNWKSITKDVESYVIIILLLETLLLAVFLVLDILLFYIFFESILPPLFILIGIFGSDNRVKASFYLFLYTLLGSLFLLLSILAMSSIMSTTDFDTIFKGNFLYITQLFLFYGIFIAFAVKTPTIFLNTWLLKAHVESPLGGSIILAAIVLKLSLYGILRLILPILPKAYMEYTYIIFLIGVITIIYASLSTLRTIDIKELIAYSSVSHAAVYLLGVFSNSIQGIEGAINLGLAHGFVSPGLFICAGGVLYDRAHTRVISYYRGVTQVMPLFAILFFILCLANCGAPLSLNFIGEFLSLYGVFERSSLFGVFASSSIIFSAAYTIYMYQRIAFGGTYSSMFNFSIPDLTKREFTILFILVVPTVLFGIYPSPILDAIHYSVSTLIYCFDSNVISCDAAKDWDIYFQNNNNGYYHTCFALLFWIVVLSTVKRNIFYIKDTIKYWYNKSGKFFLYFILANLSLTVIFLIFYVIYMMYVYYTLFEYAITNGLFTDLFGKEYAHSMYMNDNSEVGIVSSPSWKEHVFLSSGGNPNPNLTNTGQEVPYPTYTGGEASNPTNTGGEASNPYSNRPRTSIFIKDAFKNYTPPAPTPPKQYTVVYGQGDSPNLYTIAEHGEELNAHNTYNMKPGNVYTCDNVKVHKTMNDKWDESYGIVKEQSTRHIWNESNSHNLDKDDGHCFNCHRHLRSMHYHCHNCFRRWCNGCDREYNWEASVNLAMRACGLRK